MTHGKEKWLLTLVYRPPSSPPANCELLLELLEGLPPNSLLVGDFNYPYIDWASLTTTVRGKTFIEKCNEQLLEQLVTFPTHTKGNILDLVLCNNPEKVLNIKEQGRLGKSDHVALLIELSVPKISQKKTGGQTPMGASRLGPDEDGVELHRLAEGAGTPGHGSSVAIY